MAMNKETFAARRRSLEGKLKERGMDALVLYAIGSTAAFGSKSHGYMRYLCGWDSYYTPSVLVLVPGTAPCIITSDVFLHRLAQNGQWIEDIRFAPRSDAAAAVLQALRERIGKHGSTRGENFRLAYMGKSESPVPFWEELVAGLGPQAEILAFEAELDMDLAVKDSQQYAAHARAAGICDAMFSELFRLVPSGMPAFQLRTAMEKIARDAEAEHVLIWLTIAPIADYCHFYREDSRRVPQRGDQILCGIYVLHEGYWGHGIRMGAYGDPTPAMRRGYEIVREIQDAGLAALRPGDNLYAVNQAMENAFYAHFPQGGPGIFRFRTAHGLGHFSEDPLTTDPFQQAYSPGTVAKDAFIEIKRGMLFELHPNYFQAGVIGAAIGDMAYVGDKGPEMMLKFSRDFIVI